MPLMWRPLFWILASFDQEGTFVAFGWHITR